MRIHLRPVVALGIALLLGGCGSKSGSAPALPATTSGAGNRASAQFTITIPPKAAHAGSRLPKYVSASTKSVIVTLTSVNGNAYNGTASSPASIATNLTPSSPTCAMSGVNLVCTAAATAVVGSDVYTVTMYDATQSGPAPAVPAGNVLSQGSTMLAIAANQLSTGSLTLNGVIANVVVAFATNAHVAGSQAAGFSVVGNQPRTFTVTAQDADGNTIVGPGAPTFTVTSGSSAVAIAPTGTAGTYTAQVQSFSATPVQMTVTPSTGAAMTFAITTTQEVWVVNAGAANVTAYNAATGAQIAGDSITAGLSGPATIQTGPNDNLWISDIASNRIDEYVPETNSALFSNSGTTSGINAPEGIAFDSHGNLYLCISGLNEINKYSSFVGLTGSQDIGAVASGTGNASEPIGSAFDGNGVLWVANFITNTVSAYDSSLNNVALISGANTNLNGPFGVGFDIGGHLWISNEVTNSLTEYGTSGLTLANGNVAPLSTIAGSSTGMNLPQGIAFDGSGNLWVVNASSLLEYAAGSIAAGGNVAPIATITVGLMQPESLAFTP